MPKATKGKELSVKLGGTRGSGAALFGKLKEEAINVVASACYQIEEHAHFTIVPDDPKRADRVLRDNNYRPSSEDVLLVEMPNQPGALAQCLQEIAALGVNVTSAYATTTVEACALVVLKTDDDDKVVAEFNKGTE